MAGRYEEGRNLDDMEVDDIIAEQIREKRWYGRLYRAIERILSSAGSVQNPRDMEDKPELRRRATTINADEEDKGLGLAGCLSKICVLPAITVLAALNYFVGQGIYCADKFKARRGR